MFKIDNIGPVDLTNLQKCLYCRRNEIDLRGPTGATGATGGINNEYTGTGVFGPGFSDSGLTFNESVSLLRRPSTYYPLHFGDNVNTGELTPSENAIILANYSSNGSNNGLNCIAIGNFAGQFDQQDNSISIGNNAGYTGQSEYSIAIGYNAGNTSQGSNAVAIGKNSGLLSQSNNTVAIGSNAGVSGQQTYAVAIGSNAGVSGQNINAVAVGVYAGMNLQRANSIAIGNAAGQNTQGLNSIAIGYAAAINYQGQNCIAIGNGAAMTSQGNYSIALGFSSSTLGQPENCIAISAVASGVDNPEPNSCVIKPIRNVNGTSSTQMFYDSTTGELTWGTIPSSIRYKENVIPITNENIEKILQLEPVEFDFKKNGKHSFGLIAEEVNKILPQIIELNPDSGIIEGVDYTQLISPLLLLVKRQQEQINLLISRLNVANL